MEAERAANPLVGHFARGQNAFSDRPRAFSARQPPFPIDGGPDFDSEELLAYELGYRVQPFSRLALSLAAYYNDYDDLRSREQVGLRPFPSSS